MLTNIINATSQNLAPPARPDTQPRASADSAKASDRLAVHEAIAMANKAMRSLSNGLEFSLDSESGKVVVRVVDKQTQQVVRQIPSEEMLAIARALDRMQGVLVHQAA